MKIPYQFNHPQLYIYVVPRFYFKLTLNHSYIWSSLLSCNVSITHFPLIFPSQLDFHNTNSWLYIYISSSCSSGIIAFPYHIYLFMKSVGTTAKTNLAQANAGYMMTQKGITTTTWNRYETQSDQNYSLYMYVPIRKHKHKLTTFTITSWLAVRVEHRMAEWMGREKGVCMAFMRIIFM